MPTWLAPLLVGLADAFPRIAALFTRRPVATPAAPAARPGFAAIDAAEDAAVEARRAPVAGGGVKP